MAGHEGQLQAGSTQKSDYAPRYVDIGINLTDPVYRGRYRGVQKHADDLDAVIQRARTVGCHKLVVTGSDFQSIREALALSEDHPGVAYATAGIHPCTSAIFSDKSCPAEDCRLTPSEPDASSSADDSYAPDANRSREVLSELTALIAAARASDKQQLVAFGEIGLDYDRLHYCNREVQLHGFESQLKLAAHLTPQLPLFLHCRAAHRDFVSLLKSAFGDGLEKLEKKAVVHSFTGTADEVRELTDLGLFIGLNGCSFKTVENCEVVKGIRLESIMLESDGPWCEVRQSHEGWKYLLQFETARQAESEGADAPVAEGTAARKPAKNASRAKGEQPQETFKSVKKEKWEQGAMVKGRNEPCSIERIAKIVAVIKNLPLRDVCEAAWSNSIKVFGLDEGS